MVASSKFSVIKLTKRKLGHDDGTINCPVGESISGPASLKIKFILSEVSYPRSNSAIYDTYKLSKPNKFISYSQIN